jgi:hypothetical protein
MALSETPMLRFPVRDRQAELAPRKDGVEDYGKA